MEPPRADAAASLAAAEDDQRSRAEARVGTVLRDKWRIDALLGVGGMAAVYAATHRNQKRVAVKMLHPELCGNAEVRARFLREGYAANVIEHEGAVSVLDDDTTPDGAAFLVMELLEGETLEQRWARKGKRLPTIEVLTFADKLLDVLAAAHSKSIVHRDIKPENLFLTRAGSLKVLDFGIARLFENQQGLTKTKQGMVMGTPAFMAPEQALARWDDVDARTDLWAVGATMFTLLSGQHVHEARTANEQLIYSATKPARSIATAVKDLPRSVIATIDRALAFAKEQRWSAAHAMQEGIRGAIEALQARASGATFRVSAPSLAAVEEPPIPIVAIAPSSMTVSTTSLADWKAERDARAAEADQLRPAVAAAEQRVASARKRCDEIQARIDAARNDRRSAEDVFKRQVGTRTAAAEDARSQVRRALAELGRRALMDDKFASELASARAEVERLARAADARAHDVAVYEAALVAYDKRAWSLGIRVGASIAALLVALFVALVVWRATATAPPPELTPLPPPQAS